MFLVFYQQFRGLTFLTFRFRTQGKTEFINMPKFIDWLNDVSILNFISIPKQALRSQVLLNRSIKKN